MTKRDTLVAMLERYRDAQETLLCSEAGSAGNPQLMPATWNPSFRELERCLQILTDERPKQARQLLARYVDPTVTRSRLIGRRRGDGTVTFPGQPPHSEVRATVKLADQDRKANEWDVVLASWPRWVRAPLVESALQRLCVLFQGEPYLPAEMLDSLAA